MKKRKIITPEELMEMTSKERLEFYENDTNMLNEGVGDFNESNVDFSKTSVAEIAKKYGAVPMEDFFDMIEKELGIMKKPK